MQGRGEVGIWEKRHRTVFVRLRMRRNEKAYILDSDLSLQDETSEYRESTQITGVRLFGGPTLRLQRELGCVGLMTN